MDGVFQFWDSVVSVVGIWDSVFSIWDGVFGIVYLDDSVGM